MRIHDITVGLSPDIPVYPGDPAIDVESWSSIAKGDHSNISRLSFGSHSATHIDPPYHFIEEGRKVDELPLELLMGKALVLELRGVKRIGRTDLEQYCLDGTERLLLKTDNSQLWQKKEFDPGFAALAPDGAEFLLEKGVRLVGIDYLSIEPFDGDGGVHRRLLGGGVLVLEGLDLSGVKAGQYELVCLPLKVKGGDGAPARALLIGGPESSEPRFDPHTSKWPLA